MSVHQQQPGGHGGNGRGGRSGKPEGGPRVSASKDKGVSEQEELEQINSQIGQLQARKSTIEDKLHRASRLSKLEDEVKDQRALIAKLQTEIDALQKAKHASDQQAQAYHSEQLRLQQESKELQEEVGRLRRELALRSEELDKARVNAEFKDGQLIKRQQEFNNQLTHLKQQLEAKENELMNERNRPKFDPALMGPSALLNQMPHRPPMGPGQPFGPMSDGFMMQPPPPMGMGMPPFSQHDPNVMHPFMGPPQPFLSGGMDGSSMMGGLMAPPGGASMPPGPGAWGHQLPQGRKQGPMGMPFPPTFPSTQQQQSDTPPPPLVPSFAMPQPPTPQAAPAPPSAPVPAPAPAPAPAPPPVPPMRIRGSEELVAELGRILRGNTSPANARVMGEPEVAMLDIGLKKQGIDLDRDLLQIFGSLEKFMKGRSDLFAFTTEGGVWLRNPAAIPASKQPEVTVQHAPNGVVAEAPAPAPPVVAVPATPVAVANGAEGKAPVAGKKEEPKAASVAVVNGASSMGEPKDGSKGRGSRGGRGSGGRGKESGGNSETSTQGAGAPAGNAKGQGQPKVVAVSVPKPATPSQGPAAPAGGRGGRKDRV